MHDMRPAAQRSRWLLPLILLTGFAATRWPGLLPLNFSLAYGLVFCAAVFPALLPWWAVLAALLVTDLALNAFFYGGPFLNDYQLANYAAYALIFWLGRRFRRTDSWLRLGAGGLLGALAFYLVTNTASWLQNPEYAKTFVGWIQALTVGTVGWPETWKFFRNTLLSGGLFTALLAAGLRTFEPAEPEPADAAVPAEEVGSEESRA